MLLILGLLTREVSWDQLYKGKGDIAKSYNSFTPEVSLEDIVELSDRYAILCNGNTTKVSFPSMKETAASSCFSLRFS